MRYRIFGRRTGLRVSELALGAGNFIDAADPGSLELPNVSITST